MARAKGKRNRRKEKLEFVQDYLPIRDLKNGIIETTDDRYIKILEIEPINFTLRSDEEQFNIISSFASWLKISPMRLQFKSITRRADSDKHISMICEELEHEENPQCKELGEDYIGLIKDVGNREALTRRFFLIFQYEAVGRNESDDYAKIYGMLQTADSIYTDMSSVPPKMKQMPILGDLHKHLQENPMTQRLAAIISRFVTGSAQSFNRQTNVDLSNKYIVLDLSELKGKLLPVGMFIALDYVWDQIKSDRTKRKAIFIDEIWQLIGASSNRMAAEFCLEIFKVIRGFGGAAISATQDLSDFFGLEDGKYGRAIINNSKNKIILNLEPDEARYVQETLKLTRTEIRAITRFERGEALISSNNNKVPVVVKASKLEKEMITTDRAELEAILKERQREKTHSA